ncbi:MAG: glutamine-hydrolyzing GMP synthase, partial [Phycisphaerales bacterium]
MKPQTIVVLDFGGQFTQLIARRVREHHVHSIIAAPTATPDELRAENACGLILSGSPYSLTDPDAARCKREIFAMGLPVLGICYGMQLACQILGGKIGGAKASEYGRTPLSVIDASDLLAHVPEETTVWMSHFDVVTELSGDFIPLARTESCACAAVRHRTQPVYGVQFHPEVTHTPCGQQILRNFLYDICGCTGDWQVSSMIADAVDSIRKKVGARDRVICGLSGGVDSSVTATLIHKAIGDRLTCIFVDNGLMRNREAELVEATFRDHFKMDLQVAHAADRFLTKLKGVADPRQKRIIIGHEFIEVFKAEATRIKNAKYLAQGTLYPDVIESGHSAAGHA